MKKIEINKIVYYYIIGIFNIYHYTKFYTKIKLNRKKYIFFGKNIEYEKLIFQFKIPYNIENPTLNKKVIQMLVNSQIDKLNKIKNEPI